MSADLPTRPIDPDKIERTGAIGPDLTEKMPEKGKFASLMNSEESTHTLATTPNQVSPMDLTKQTAPTAGTPPTMHAVHDQMKAVSSTLGDIKSQLHTKNLSLKQSQKYLLRNKLTSANTNIRFAAERAGIDPGKPVDLSSKKNPIAKFLDLVTDGQTQLNEAASQVQALNSSGQALNPGQLLLIQTKLQKAQQELDYTSVLLGKAVDTIKTLFNVQI